MLALSACGSWGPGARINEEVLTADLIKNWVSGNTLTGEVIGGQLSIWYREDGFVFARGRDRNDRPFYDQGLWFVGDDRLCVRWDRMRAGRQNCDWMAGSGDQFRLYEADGTPSMRGRVVEGNPFLLDEKPATPLGPTG